MSMSQIFAHVDVTAAARSNAIGDIQRVFGTAAGKSLEVPMSTLVDNARAPFTMVEHEPALAEAFIRKFQDLVVWKHDGNCFNRAMAGVHLLDEMSGLGAGPADDVFAGAIHVERELDKVTGELTGRFHGSAAMRIKGHQDPVVIDYLNDRPFTRFSEHDLPPDTELIRPYAGTGVPWLGGGARSTYVGASFFDGAAQWLGNAWHNNGTRDVRPEELERMVASAHDLGAANGPLLDNRKIGIRSNDMPSFD